MNRLVPMLTALLLAAGVADHRGDWVPGPSKKYGYPYWHVAPYESYPQILRVGRGRGFPPTPGLHFNFTSPRYESFGPNGDGRQTVETVR